MPFLALLCVSAFWGAHAVVGKAAELQLPPLPLTVWRFTLGALCFLPMLSSWKRLLRQGGRVWEQVIGCGLLLSVIYPLFYYQSLEYITPVESLLVVNTAPFMSAILARLFYKETLIRRQWLGIVLSFIGIFVLVFGEWSGVRSLFGIGLAFIGTAAFASYSVASRPLFRQMPLTDVLAGTSLCGAVFLWIVALCSGSRFKGVVTALHGLTPTGWAEFAYIVLIVSTLAYVLYGYGLKKLPSGVATSVTVYPQVVFAAILQWIWFGFVPSWLTVVSAILILGGTGLMRRKTAAS